MAQVPTPSGSYTTPDGDEPPQLDYWTAQLAAQVEKIALQHTKGTRARVHIAEDLGGTTDANGYVTVNHGAPFTPRSVTATINRSGIHLGYIISCDTFTATTVRVRLGNWSAGGALNAASLGTPGTLDLVCWE